jgi:hypothetical protein
MVAESNTAEDAEDAEVRIVDRRLGDKELF